MLMKLGPITFEIYPFNAISYDHAHSTPFVEKPVLGVRPPLEWVGDGPETWSIQAKLFPAKLGGLDDLQILFQARASGRPQYLVRGDGVAMGWVGIESVRERSTYLDAMGVGQIIEVDIGVKRASGPSSGTFFSIMAGASAGGSGGSSGAAYGGASRLPSSGYTSSAVGKQSLQRNAALSTCRAVSSCAASPPTQRGTAHQNIRRTLRH